MNTIEIKIINWEKYNGGRKGKVYPWFKLSNDFLLDPTIRGLSAADVRLFIALLSTCSRLSSSLCHTSVILLSSLCGSKRQKIINGISKLVSVGLIEGGGLEQIKLNQNKLNQNRARDASRDAPAPPKDQSLQDQSDKPLGVNAFIAAYARVFKARPEYGTNPTLSGKDVGIAKRIVKSQGPDKAIRLVIAYLEMNKPWFLEKKHDLVTFENNLNEIGIMAETGRELVTRKTAIEQKADFYEDQRARIMRGEI